LPDLNNKKEKKVKKIFFTICAVAGLFGSKSLRAQEQKTITACPGDSVRAWLARYHVPAVAIGIIEGNKIKSIDYYGEFRAGIPASASTLWNVASLTKPVTAMTVMSLLERHPKDHRIPCHRFHRHKSIQPREQNKSNVEANAELYKKRQSIVEHPYGTIKRQWGFDYIITKRGMKRASADVGLMFVAYNLRRLMNIIDKNAFMKFLQELMLLLKRKTTPVKLIIFKMPDFFFATHFRQVFLYAS
jgi:hypothetical protein